MASNAQERASLKTSLSLWHSGDKVGYSWIQHYLYSEHRSWEKDGKGIRESLLAAITIDMHRLWVCLERGFHGIFVPAAPVASCYWGLCRHFWCDEYHHQDTDWRWWPPALHNLEKMQAGCSVDESNGCSKLQEEAADHRQMSSGDRDHPGTLAMGRLGGFLDRKDPEYTSTNGNSQELEFEGAEVSPWISWKTFKQGLNLS